MYINSFRFVSVITKYLNFVTFSKLVYEKKKKKKGDR
jgi:hypothetical protein